jgi:hypothetical protein
MQIVELFMMNGPSENVGWVQLSPLILGGVRVEPALIVVVSLWSQSIQSFFVIWCAQKRCAPYS